jgi:signal transduction histidine kinase
MVEIKKTENNITIIALTYFLIVLVGYLDYITGVELSFSFFYLIPISILALNKRVTIFPIIIGAVFASLLWFFADYSTRSYSIIFFPIWNAGVRLAIFLIIGLMLNYLKEKQKQLNKLNDELTELNSEKNTLIGVAAHDLRNPIGGVYALSENLCDAYNGMNDNEIKDTLSLIKEFSNNSLTIISNLLDVSKIESGKVELNIKEYDYISFIKEHITLNQIIANHKNIKIDYLFSELDVKLKFDYSRLGEVIDNLFTNAIKYSNPASNITVKVSGNPGNIILTEVIDNGIGISKDEQEKLFNYFEKTSSRPTAGEVSTGLGLAIAKKMIILHNGTIGLKDNLPNGCIFYYTLPQ